MPEEKLIAEMAKFHEELQGAGALLDASGLQPSSRGWRIAMEWARRFPNPAGDGREGEIDVRQVFELEDFGPSEAVERFREIGAAGKM